MTRIQAITYVACPPAYVLERPQRQKITVTFLRTKKPPGECVRSPKDARPQNNNEEHETDSLHESPVNPICLAVDCSLWGRKRRNIVGEHDCEPLGTREPAGRHTRSCHECVHLRSQRDWTEAGALLPRPRDQQH